LNVEAGYDRWDGALLNKSTRKCGHGLQFLSDHPNPATANGNPTGGTRSPAKELGAETGGFRK